VEACTQRLNELIMMAKGRIEHPKQTTNKVQSPPLGSEETQENMTQKDFYNRGILKRSDVSSPRKGTKRKHPSPGNE
jgi:hypothetical protein